MNSEEKYLVFDSSSLINFSMNSSLDTLKKLKKIFGGKFLITLPVKYETIDHPRQIKRFSLGALQIKKLLDEGVIELAENHLDKDALNEKTKELLQRANQVLIAKNEPITLMQDGEASCLALMTLLKGEKLLVVDERTTRMLCESPENLRKLMQKKLHTGLKLNQQNLELFRNTKIIRSCELVYLAYKNKLIDLTNGNVLEALLYAFKLKGCSISEKEIDEMKRL